MVAVPSPALVVLVGASGSGKSTWAEGRFADDEVVSTDRLRAVVGRSRRDVEASDDAFDLVERILVARCGRGLLTVIDSTGLDDARRRRWSEVAQAAGLPTLAGDRFELRERLAEIVRAAEGAGFESVWVMDHLVQIPFVGRPWLDMLESYTTLAYLAGVTERIRLGTMVTGITFRNVAHLAKIIATLDVVSGGRAEAGVGAAWFAHEHKAYGYDFPSDSERLDLLEDALQLLPAMWGPGAKPFEGKTISLPETTCYPRPLQEHIPILVGGAGEKRTLRLVAQYADACNFRGSFDGVARGIEVLHRHCADVGRPTDEVRITHLDTVLVGDDPAGVRETVDRLRDRRGAPEFAAAVNAATVEDHVVRFQRFADAGVDLCVVSLPDISVEAVDRFKRVIDTFDG